MSLDIRRPRVRLWNLPVISAVATILIAATVDPERNWDRLRSLPPNERQRLDESLRRFDLLYSPDQQQSLRELDRKINQTEPTRQSELLAALHRYHNWLDLLPETKQEELKQTPPAERMALVKKFLSDHPAPNTVSAQFLRFIDVGEVTPFELAAIYKIWETLKPDEKRQVEQLPRGRRRRDELFKLGATHNLPSEIKPDDFEEERWAKELESFANKRNRPALLLEEMKKTQAARRQEILRRQMINYHYIERAHHPKGVTPERLAEFLALFPPWLQSSFDHYPPEEARRRLTIVYRLVFPPPSEIKATQRAAAGPPAAAPTTKPGSPGRKQNPTSKAIDSTKSAKSPF